MIYKIFIDWLIAVLEFDLGALLLLGKRSTTWATFPASQL
jgi:hypothetical protein